MPERSLGTALAEALGAGPGRVLLPRAEGAPREMVERLREQGWEPDEVEAYRNVRVLGQSAEAERVRAGEFDVLTFASGSAARAFVELIAPPDALALSPSGR